MCEIGRKVAFCLPTAGRRTQFFSPHIHTTWEAFFRASLYSVCKVCSALLIGAIRDATGDHDSGFYFSGSVMLLSALMVFSLCVAKHLNEKEERMTQNENYSTNVQDMLQSTCNLQTTIVVQLGLPPSHCHRQNSGTVNTRL